MWVCPTFGEIIQQNRKSPSTALTAHDSTGNRTVMCNSHMQQNTKNSDIRKIAVITLKLEQFRFGDKNADGMANSVDPDQTASPLSSRSSLTWV